MTSGADLFVVCKQCGSEVSPYITECPYCGGRLRQRAPKLPRVGAGRASGRSQGQLGSLLHRSKPRRTRSSGESRFGGERSPLGRPYATLALVLASALMWVAVRAEPQIYIETTVLGPLGGSWWKLFTYEFSYLKGLYALVTIAALALFGWRLELRHGPVAVLVLFFGAGATGALVASAVYSLPIVGGANASALALLAAWAVPDLEAMRAGVDYEGDLLGAGAIAALLLAIPFALRTGEASWLAGVVGALLGLMLGFAMHRRVEAG